MTQPNGKIQSRRNRGILPDAKPEPQPGATVYVPERGPATVGSTFASVASTTAQVLASLIGLLVLIRRL